MVAPAEGILRRACALILEIVVSRPFGVVGGAAASVAGVTALVKSSGRHYLLFDAYSDKYNR